jgi:DUF4097 and DUF4098 domain-containing protein YvlB
MNNARAYGFIVAALLLTPVSGVAPAAQGPGDDWCREDRGNRDRQYCEVRQFTVPATAGTVSVQGTNGGIAVEGQARGDVYILAKINASASSQARAQEIAKAVQINATLDRVDADGPRSEGREGWSVSYRLAVPRALNLSLRTTNGGISIQDVESKVEFTTTNGGVKLMRLDGDVRGRTTNGGVDVELDGPSWQGEGLDVETTNGGVRVLVPEHYSAQLEAHTNNGGVSVTVPGTVRGSRNDQDVFIQLGSGGAPIKLRTSNGGVRVSRK